MKGMDKVDVVAFLALLATAVADDRLNASPMPEEKERPIQAQTHLPPAETYVVVVSKSTGDDPEWARVVAALKDRHNAILVEHRGDVGTLKDQLSLLLPRYICFVCKPEECGREFVKAVHRLTRALDEDPYGDAVWGIVTGYDVGDSLKMARMEPLRARFSASMGPPTNWVEAGFGFNENKVGVRWRKEKGKEEVEIADAPVDPTREMVDLFNEDKVQIFWAGGHATERDWQLGYRVGRRYGQFRTYDGKLCGVTASGEKLPITTTNPKICMPTGNCLIGHVNSADNCMALSWISHGALQFIGYTVPTWYGHYNSLHYWVKELQGRFTIAEAFFLCGQTLLWNLESKRASDARHQQGHLYDRDVVAYYGNPAADARLGKCTAPPYEQILAIEPSEQQPGWLEVTLTIKMATGAGAWGLRRPAAVIFPYRLKNARNVKQNGEDILVTDSFVMFRGKQGEYEVGTSWEVSFLAQQTASWESTLLDRLLNELTALPGKGEPLAINVGDDELTILGASFTQDGWRLLLDRLRRATAKPAKKPKLKDIKVVVTWTCERSDELSESLDAFCHCLGIDSKTSVVHKKGPLKPDKKTWVSPRGWRFSAGSSIAKVETDAPGDRARSVYIGTDADGTDKGALYCLDAASGKLQWKFTTGARHYRPDDALRVRDLAVGDLDGDGKKEVAVVSCHSKWFPGRLCVLDSSGKLVGEFWNPGHISSVKIADLEGDGKFEVVVSGVNNDAGMAPFVACFSGTNVRGGAAANLKEKHSAKWYALVRGIRGSATIEAIEDSDSDGVKEIKASAAGRTFVVNAKGK